MKFSNLKLAAVTTVALSSAPPSSFIYVLGSNSMGSPSSPSLHNQQQQQKYVHAVRVIEGDLSSLSVGDLIKDDENHLPQVTIPSNDHYLYSNDKISRGEASIGGAATAKRKQQRVAAMKLAVATTDLHSVRKRAMYVDLQADVKSVYVHQQTVPSMMRMVHNQYLKAPAPAAAMSYSRSSFGTYQPTSRNGGMPMDL